MRIEQGQNVDTGLMFVTRNGKPQSKRNALRAWTAALHKIGVEANLHSLRHTFISAHAERDTPVVLVSDLVGHSRVTTTQTQYTVCAVANGSGSNHCVRCSDEGLLVHLSY